MIRELFLRDMSLWSCLWQSTLIAVAGLTGSFLLRRRPARAARVLFLAIIAAVLLPAMSVLVKHYELGLLVEKPIVLPYLEIEIPTETTEMLLASEILPVVPEELTRTALAKDSSTNIEIPWRSISLFGWMTATLILLGRLIIAFVSGIRLLRRAQSVVCEYIGQAADSAGARLGITKSLQIRSSTNVRSPMIWCWSRPPILLVPGDMDSQINWADVICHELAHWMRSDHISGLIAELAVCILPWNLLLWWSKKRMVRLSEQACDDWVLAGGRAGTDYAQSLLNMSPELQMAFMPTVIGKEKPMKKRIYRIVKEKCGIPQVGPRWALAVTIIAATLTVGVALAQRRPARLEPRQRDERVAAERREQQAIAERRGDLENRARQLRARFEEVRAELAELEASGGAESDKEQALRNELHQLEEAKARLEQKLQELEGDRRQREMRPWPDQEPPHEILRRLDELSRETEFLLQGLADQHIGRNDETNMLYNRIRELNEQMQQVRQQLGRQLVGPGRQSPEFNYEQMRDRFTREFRRQANPEARMMEQEELKERARQIELELKELGDRNPDRAEKLHAELREIHESSAQMQRDAASSDIRQATLRGLREQTQQLERRLQELRDNHPDQAHELRMQLEQIRQQMQRNRRDPDRSQRQRSRNKESIQPGDEFHRQELMVRREQLQAQLKELELVLGELNQQGKAESEEAKIHRRRLHALQQQLREIENEFSKSELDRPQERRRDDLEVEVQNLRQQMDGMNEQMGEMRELIERLLENKQSQSIP